MEEDPKYNLDKRIYHWLETIQKDASLSKADFKKLKIQLFDLMEELKINGLDEEEAFIIACKRLGKNTSWQLEHGKEHNSAKQMRRALIILAGVFFYFLFYHFFRATATLLFLVLSSQEVDGFIAADWVSRYLISWQFFIIVFFVSIYFFDEKTIRFIERIKFKPKQTLYLLLIIIFLGTTDTSIFPLLKRIVRNNTPLRNEIINSYIYFDYTFPSVILLGFIFIYYRYYKKAKV